ncbi:hypothetical protein BDK51DRAFT_31841 [Blyttiomyces helicus]|uniref:Armadillo-type protein n=1 Tax=Blyttiomyces helicus TaxID=388810 RepID=A0A4P9WBR2_9FUNG|nr:hypothetical protein BDK51DRAFT_31841 [Blyttiomyces helicus]|eukprot:RKO89702.1 hypothetical protein BDK51DRAFT_31841 [Blyttiomyces helicus]
MTALLGPANLKEAAQTALNKFLKACTDMTLIEKLLPWLHSFYDHDDGEIISVAIDRFRQKGLAALSTLIPLAEAEIKNIATPADAFVFSPAFLATRSNELEAESGPRREDNTNVAAHLAVIDAKDASVDMKRASIQILAGKIGEFSEAPRSWRDRSTQLAIARSILAALDDATEEWIRAPESFPHALKLVRTLAESKWSCDVVAGSALLSKAWFVKFVWHPDAPIRYEIARTYFATAFRPAAFREVRGPSTPQHARDDELDAPICVPDFVARHFHVYGPLGRVETNDNQIEMRMCGAGDSFLAVVKDYRRRMATPYAEGGIGYGDPNSLIIDTIGAAFAQSREARSHSDFSSALQVLHDLCWTEENCAILLDAGFESVLRRFLLVPPASGHDQQILADLLNFLNEVLRFRPMYLRLREILLAAIPSVLLPILESAANENDVHSNAALSVLSAEALCVLKSAFRNMDERELTALASTSSCIQILKDYTHHNFASETGSAKNHAGRITCLTTLLSFASLPTLAASIPSEAFAAIVGLFVQIVGFSQQNHDAPTAGDAFTYRDRSVYRWAALCLRTVSRSAVLVRAGAWGDHWLFDGDIGWLLGLLDDDEKVLQKLGLGTLGNLILMKGSYRFVCAKIPQFLDMAFAQALDFERAEGQRKEAIGIINNFLITFCHDHKVIEVELLPGNEDSLSEIDTGWAAGPTGEGGPMNGYDPTKELLHIFEQFAFLDRVHELLESGRAMVAYRGAVTELLLNLSLAAPDFVRRKMSDTDAWGILVEFLVDPLDPFEPGQRGNPNGGEYQSAGDAMRGLRRRQFRAVHSRLSDRVRCNVLRMLDVAIYGCESVRAVIFDRTRIVAAIGSILDEFTPVVADADLAGLTLHTLASFAVESRAALPRELIALLAGPRGARALHVTLVLLRARRDPARSACLFVARLLSLHYGEVVDLAVDRHLDEPLPDGRGSLGPELCRELIGLLFAERDEVIDSVLMESVKIALQCLLGRCGFAKQLALQRSTQAKMVAGQHGVYHILSDILFSKDFSDVLVLEALACLRNLIANCAATKRLAFEPARMKGPVATAAGSVARIVKTPSCPDDAFAAAIEVLKILALYSESRTAMVKVRGLRSGQMNLLQDLSGVLRRVLKAKDHGKAELVLQFLRNVTLASDGQMHVVRVTGKLSRECV